MPRMRTRVALFTVLTLALPLAACANDENDESASGSDTTSGSSGELMVFAAASLTGVFTDLGKKFEAAHPGVKVAFNFGSSGTLATQINEGAPADVFASASPATMKAVTDAGNGAGTAVTFVRNRLEIAVPEGNPGEVDGLDDFTNDGLDIALCAPTAPCGAAADTIFTGAGLEPKPDTREADVKAVLTKVESGEVDAALVYHTDVLSAAAGKIEGISFDESSLAVNDYLISALSEADDADLAADWVAYVQSDEAQDALAGAGFEPVGGSGPTPSTTPSSTPSSTPSTEPSAGPESTESASATPTSS